MGRNEEYSGLALLIGLICLSAGIGIVSGMERGSVAYGIAYGIGVFGFAICAILFVLGCFPAEEPEDDESEDDR